MPAPPALEPEPEVVEVQELAATEAMVAIDVNSGRSRSARDSETNAFNTNKEAVDEIARQLRLRDLGGIIVSDLIDMRSSKHRREIEERLEGNLRRDRAKTTTLEISDFGIMEMTRQRMRPGLHKGSYMDCPHCQGSGEVRVPDAVAADIDLAPAELARWAYVGDSTNDQVMFQRFPFSVGVANLKRFEAELEHWPAWITQGERGLGFAELARALLVARQATLRT